MNEQTIAARYVGQRMTTKNKLAHYWLFDGEEVERGYIKNIVAYALVGELFMVTQQENRSVYSAGPKAPKRMDAEPHPQVQEWIAKHHAAKQQDAERKAVAAMKARPDEFEKALKPLRELVYAAKDHTTRAALIARITGELWR